MPGRSQGGHPGAWAGSRILAAQLAPIPFSSGPYLERVQSRHVRTTSQPSGIGDTATVWTPPMTPLLPLELLQTLNRDVPCRESQVDQLATFFNVGLLK